MHERLVKFAHICGPVDEILVGKSVAGRKPVTKKVQANKKSLHLNCLVDPGYSFKFYIEIKVKTTTKIFMVDFEQKINS